MYQAFVRPHAAATESRAVATMPSASAVAGAGRSSRALRRLRAGVSLIGVAATTLFAAQTASAQTVTPNIVSACSGVSLPRSVVTDILRPVINGVVDPIQSTVNPILGSVNAVISVPLVSALVPPLTVSNLNINATGLLDNAANGSPITLQVLNANGTVVGPADRCDTQADSFSLRTPATAWLVSVNQPQPQRCRFIWHSYCASANDHSGTLPPRLQEKMAPPRRDAII